MKKLLVYLSLVASLIALIGFVITPSAISISGLHSNTSLDIGARFFPFLFQASSWLGFVGGLIVFLSNKERKLKNIGLISLAIPSLIVIYRYGFIILFGGI